MELTEKIELAFNYGSTRKRWKNKFNSDEYKFCSDLNEELFGMKFNRRLNCECVNDFFILLNSRYGNKQQIINIMEKQFVVKKGKVIHTKLGVIGFNTPDEKCIKLLKSNPKFIKDFEKYPANWEEIVSGEAVEETETKVVDETVTDESKEGEIVLTDADATADLEGKPRPDNPTVKPLSEMSNKEIKEFAKSIGLELLTNAKEKMIAEITAFQNKAVEETETGAE